MSARLASGLSVVVVYTVLLGAAGESGCGGSGSRDTDGGSSGGSSGSSSGSTGSSSGSSSGSASSSGSGPTDSGGTCACTLPDPQATNGTIYLGEAPAGTCPTSFKASVRRNDQLLVQLQRRDGRWRQLHSCDRCRRLQQCQ